MDQAVIRALAKWPTVPAVYDWLALDERGNWLLRNPVAGDFERIGNAALREFIGRNYAPDAHGRWFFQNGPQRVYVRLACAPLVFHLDGDRIVDQCGRPAGRLTGAWRDERGALILAAVSGPGNLDDRDLLAASDLIVESGAGAWFGRDAARVPLGSMLRDEMPARFGFVRDPRPERKEGADSG